MEAFGHDIAAVVNELGLSQVVLIGHSMGGPVVVEAALELGRRVIGIVGVDTFKDYGTTYSEEQIESIFEPFRANFVGTTKVWVRENGFLPTSDPELVEWVAEDMASGPPAVALEAGAEMWRWLGRQSRTALGDLQVPGVLINSDLGNTDVAAIREYTSVPFDAVLMSGVGHFVMMEDPETFNAFLSEAIAGFVP
jgi:pimeloyl-ACP methyl ester carboxylesterase